jgi:hypothetical protein
VAAGNTARPTTALSRGSATLFAVLQIGRLSPKVETVVRVLSVHRNKEQAHDEARWQCTWLKKDALCFGRSSYREEMVDGCFRGVVTCLDPTRELSIRCLSIPVEAMGDSNEVWLVRTASKRKGRPELKTFDGMYGSRCRAAFAAYKRLWWYGGKRKSEPHFSEPHVPDVYILLCLDYNG